MSTRNPEHSCSHYDTVIIGGGHNGLAAAAYLARAGQSVLLLEKLAMLGGAAISTRAFAGMDANLSRYSYLVSLLPQRVINELGLELSLLHRRYSSYTPDPGHPTRGLLVDNEDSAATAASFAAIGAPGDEAGAFERFYADCRRLTEVLWPTFTGPLPSRSEAKSLAVAAGAGQIWEKLIEQPLGEVITEALGSDLARGVVLTDGLIGTFSRADEPDLQQNICFLYHLVGGGTGAWDLPVGGMGAVSAELERAAREAGATLITGAEVLTIGADREVSFTHEGITRTVDGDFVLSNVAPAVLNRLGGRELVPAHPNNSREGAQVKVNLLLRRLPRLRDETLSPEAAFGGTFHINESYTQLQHAYEQADRGRVPSPLPCEIYCHTLSDPSILSTDLRDSGAHTLTVFGLHVPHSLITQENNDVLREELQAAVFASLNSVLAEPVEDLLLLDAHGIPCVETKTTLDIERAVGMPGGNIFHGGLDWPFLEDDAPRDTPAKRWGVSTAESGILLCGSGSRRGGAVSALGGYGAAMAVLEASARPAADAGRAEVSLLWVHPKVENRTSS